MHLPFHNLCDDVPLSALQRSSPLARREKFELISIHETNGSAKIAMQLYDPYSYVFDHNDGKRGRATTYKCVEHKLCERQFRIRSFNADLTGQDAFALEARGVHMTAPSARKKTGIHPAFIVEVDAAVSGDAGPRKILNTLTHKYEGQPHLFINLPSVDQIKSRKANLMNKLAKQTQIETFAELCEWASLRMCTTEHDFFGERGFERANDEQEFAAQPPGYANGTLVLKCFKHRYEEEGVSKLSFGLIFTTRRIFRNVLYAAEGQKQGGVFAAADGTYKLHYGTSNSPSNNFTLL
jgi:hypothetical protein